jgi:hypothetical protein
LLASLLLNDKKKWKSGDLKVMMKKCDKIVMYGRVMCLPFEINTDTIYFGN